MGTTHWLEPPKQDETACQKKIQDVHRKGEHATTNKDLVNCQKCLEKILENFMK